MSPDGHTLVFVGYTPAGFDLFAMPYPSEEAGAEGPTPAASSPETDRRVSVVDEVGGAAAPTDNGEDEVMSARAAGAVRYTPWSTLRPTSWMPIIQSGTSRELRVGIATTGVAGPEPHDGQPVGSVWVAVATPEGCVERHLDLLAKRDTKKLMAATGCDEQDLRWAQQLIRQCDPKPGRAFASDVGAIVIPDVIVQREIGRAHV